MSKKEGLDRVKKYDLCRKCLKSLKKVKHDVKQCPAPDFSDCGKYHHSLICPEEKKEVDDYYGDGTVFEGHIRFHESKLLAICVARFWEE